MAFNISENVPALKYVSNKVVDPCTFVQMAIDAYDFHGVPYGTKFGDLPRELKKYSARMSEVVKLLEGEWSRIKKSQFYLAWCLYFCWGDPESSINHEKFVNVTNELLERGDAGGQFLAGLYYAEGHRTEQNIEEAKAWLEQAVENGSPHAPYALMKLGGSDRYNDNLQLLRMSASRGFVLAFMEMDERVFESHFPAALRWMVEAAKTGNEQAKERLRKWRLDNLDLHGGPKNAADMEQVLLAAQLRLNGLGWVEQDVEDALDYIRPDSETESLLRETFEGTDPKRKAALREILRLYAEHRPYDMPANVRQIMYEPEALG